MNTAHWSKLPKENQNNEGESSVTKNQYFKETLKKTITGIIGSDRPFMDVPDVVGKIIQNILPIIEQSQNANDSQKKEVIVTVKSGIVEVEKAPPGSTVTLRDYDIQDEPESGLIYEESIFEF